MPRFPATRRRSSRRRTTTSSSTSAVPSEHQEQVVLVARVEQFLPGVLFYAVPNGGKRHRTVAAQLKAEGTKAGVPDLVFAEPRGGYHGLYLEMKRQKGGSVSKSQRRWERELKARGYFHAVARGADEGWRVVQAYLALQDGARDLLS